MRRHGINLKILLGYWWEMNLQLSHQSKGCIPTVTIVFYSKTEHVNTCPKQVKMQPTLISVFKTAMYNSFPTICETTVKTKNRIYGINHWEECLVKQFINIQVSFYLGPQSWIESNIELLNWEQRIEVKCGWLLRANEMLLSAESNFFYNSQGIIYCKRCWGWIEIREKDWNLQRI